MAAGAENLLAGLGSLRIGKRLGRYQLVAPLGRGGMAVVWLARRDDGGVVALKTMLPALSADPRFESMFLAEARLAATFDHRSIARVEAFGETNGQLWIAMEHVRGASLAALSRETPVDPWVAARIAVDVARGLHAAHESCGADGQPLAIVHRDVSPQNVLVAASGEAKIADFGVARFEGGPATQAGFVKGKVRYMAPEQVYCEKVDRRTDVFALGVVLYETTTGVHPFAAATDTARLARLADADEAAPAGAHVDDFPPELAAPIARALAKEPDARFATMADFADALEHAVAGRDVDVGQVVRERCAEGLADQDRALASSRGLATRRSRRVAIVAVTLALGGLLFGLAVRARMSTPGQTALANATPATPAEEPTRTGETKNAPAPLAPGETTPVEPPLRATPTPAARWNPPEPSLPVPAGEQPRGEPSSTVPGPWKPGILDTSD